MEELNIENVEGLDELASPVVAVGISGSRKTEGVISWALDKFVPQGLIHFKLLHVRPVISRIPTPLGNLVPISQVRDDVAATFRREVEWQTAEKLLPYLKMCIQRKVQVELVQIESDDIVTAISEDILKYKINTLVIGSSSPNIFTRGRTQSSRISECCPSFCAVYVVSKGKLSSLRPSNSETILRLRDDSSDSATSSIYYSSSSSSQADWSDHGSLAHFRSASLPVQPFQSFSSINETPHKRMPSSGIVNPGNLRLDAESSDGTNIFPGGLDASETLLYQPSTFETSTKDRADINYELEKLKIELRHVRGMYEMAKEEAIDASRKLNELQKRHLEEEVNLLEMSLKEEEAKELARQEKKRYEKAKREAELVKDWAKGEEVERQEAEIRVSQQTKENKNLESVLKGDFYQYRRFTWEEIITATSSFSENLKIGMGAYGTVYKSSFQHTTAAVKVLHAKEGSRIEQFHQELEILSKIRHPHLLILLGVCADRNCLVYEFMENGSLEDRLLRRNNTPPLLWFDRVRIAWELASALVFLHNSKPKAIIHRDLKPGNILLDRNNVSKIGDVGLSTMISDDPLLSPDSAPVGTLCYIDPEYQRSGVVSPKSDVYAFGMIVLQLLTGKPAIGLAHKVENAVGDNRMTEIVDTESGTWPIKEANDLALLALKCIELRQRDRPDLQSEVLPALEKLKDAAERAQGMALVSAPSPPKHFTCPILKEAMSDPWVAADGYTYERKAIEAWLQENDTSPITELPLPHKHLIPNHALLSAIMEWKSRK